MLSVAACTKAGAWVGVQEYCWRKGQPRDLVAYCDRQEHCDALALYPRGFSVSSRQKYCWSSAFFKSGGGRSLDLGGRLSLAPQAVLLVKKSKWARGFERAKVREARATRFSMGPKAQSEPDLAGRLCTCACRGCAKCCCLH